MSDIVPTDVTADSIWTPLAKDYPDLRGMLALWPVQPHADCLKRIFVGVNWNAEEMEKYKDSIVDRKLL